MTTSRYGLLLDRLGTAKILGVLRVDDMTFGIKRARELREVGMRAIECTLDSPGAMEILADLASSSDQDASIGAGTVTTKGQVDSLVDIGAHFCVTPHLDPDLLEYSLALGMPMLPGVMTPTELTTALRIGAPAVKLFPAGPLGVSYLRSLRGPFGDFAVIPTGGIEVEEVPAWLAAGALCVGIGSALTRSTIPENLVTILSEYDTAGSG